jgi:hypothetical protein
MDTSQKILIIENAFTLSQIKENEDYTIYINNLIKQSIKFKGKCTLDDLIKLIHSSCPELKEFCNENSSKFKLTSIKDKGLVGKIVEFDLFGNLPNNNSCPDMDYGDIKTTNFKSIGKNNPKSFNAKERLTITNFGDPSKQTNIDKIADKNYLNETLYYEKIKRGIIIIFQHDSNKFETIQDNYNRKIIGIIKYNLDDVFTNHPDIASVFHEDFIKIKTCIIAKNVSQSGQQYLHIHPHGSKNSNTRAFGFTNKFLTKLVSIYLKVPLITKGRSDYIEF